MAFSDRYNTSIHGRRLGLQAQSSAQRGGGAETGKKDFIVGAEDIRKRTSTAETTSAGLPAYGVSVLANSSAGSSQSWYLDPPIPGVYKTVIFATTVNTQYLKTKNSEFIKTTQGTTMCTLASTLLRYTIVTLIPEGTGAWVAAASSDYLLASTST